MNPTYLKPRTWINRIRRAGLRRILQGTSPEYWENLGETKALRAFQRASQKVPAYHNLLTQRNVNPTDIQSIKTFKRLVPLLNKKNTFEQHTLSSLCINGKLTSIEKFTSSSGASSSQFSFGISTPEDECNAVTMADDAFALIFGTDRRRTLIINALPSGVTIPTRLPQTATGPRADTVQALLDALQTDFEQFILMGDPHFLKDAVERITEDGHQFPTTTLHLVSGGDWMPEQLRTYLAKLLGHDFAHPENGFIGSTMGLTELGLNLLHETPATVRIRRAALADVKLRTALFGSDAQAVPMLCHYYPHRTYLETIKNTENKNDELVFSTVDLKRRLPLLRYRSGDCGKLLPFRHLKKVLIEFGYESLVPTWQLPLVAVAGRANRFLNIGGKHIRPEDVRAGLYANHNVAAATTGAFQMSEEGNMLKIIIGLRDIRLNWKRIEKFAKLRIHESTKVAVRLDFQIFSERPDRGIDFGRKFQHLGKSSTPTAATNSIAQHHSLEVSGCGKSTAFRSG